LRVKWLVVLFGFLLGGLALVFAFGLDVPLPGSRKFSIKPVGRELVPSEDQNRFVLNLICPVGSSVDYVDEMLRRGEKILLNMRDPRTGKEVIAGFYASLSIRPGSLISEGIMFVRLLPTRDENGNPVRTLTQNEIMAVVRSAYAGIPGVKAIA